MHRIRLLTTMLLLALMPGAAVAEEEWFQRQFAPVPTQPRPTVRPAERPAQAAVAEQRSAWRTVVIPAAVSPTQLAATTRTMAARQTAAAPMMRPLTGYAHEMRGLASYYWEQQMTSSGERFNPHELTAAHKTLPLGTRVRVTNLANGMSTIVRINDRGPFKAGRVIDLSEAAAQQIHMTGAGIVRVALDVVN